MQVFDAHFFLTRWHDVMISNNRDIIVTCVYVGYDNVIKNLLSLMIFCK